jgi:hypothetical protein
MRIKKIVPINKKLYENFYDESLFIEFVCPNSLEKQEINILEDYNFLEDLVNNNLLQKEDIIKNGLARITNKHNNYLGLFSVYTNLSANYKLIKCEESTYIVVFDFGEIQAGRSILYVSGIWEIG